MVWMYIEKAKDLRLGITKTVPDGAGFERRILRQLDDHLHAQRPLAPRMTFRQAEVLIESLSNCAHRTIAHHGKLGQHIHSGHEAVGGRAIAVYALVGQRE